MRQTEKSCDRVIENLRGATRRRRRDAVILVGGAVVLAGVAVWMRAYAAPLDGTIEVLRSATASPEVTVATLRREVWYAHDMAVLHARYERAMSFFTVSIGALLGFAVVRLLPDRSDVLVDMWDRLGLLERKVQEQEQRTQTSDASAGSAPL